MKIGLGLSVFGFAVSSLAGYFFSIFCFGNLYDIKL